jgi:4-methyl-5(b-hydroxyethyl)-thiazole monophosphate biosynthesis
MIIVLLADGFEEIEALTPVDMLRRAGFEVKTVGITSKIAVGSHNIPVVCDAVPADINLSDVSMAIFPGGMPGSLNLDASPYTDEVINSVLDRGGHIAAICAAPLVFGRRGLLNGKSATCFPGFESELIGATVTGEEFVTDGNITTGKGMEYSLPFAKELVRIAKSE